MTMMLSTTSTPFELERCRIRNSLVGSYAPLATPFGTKPLVYADYTASGRSLSFIETAIARWVLPFYANTHSEASFTGRHSTRLREQARDAVRRAVQAGDDDAVIFVGSGATAAVNLLVDRLGLAAGGAGHAEPDQRAVVFIGPYEHHSNELPWRESLAEVVRIGLDDKGGIDQSELEQKLLEYADRPLRVGSFSAASNVTGVISDVAAITRLLKSQGALACWDYAAGAPYLSINMNAPDAEIDALFLSPHKFLGGPGTAGVLAIKKRLLAAGAPNRIGGGTVSYVAPDHHTWVTDVERREEGGTPGIVECIRTGLVMGLKDRLDHEQCANIEAHYQALMMTGLSGHDGVEVLGPENIQRLPIMALRFPRGDRELHYGFVTALLNDVFGIQARGGCSCAGPYGHDLLALDEAQSRDLEAGVIAGYGSLRPGWVRLNGHWVCDVDEINYLIRAVQLVATYGHRLLASYKVCTRTGLWQHREYEAAPVMTLEDMLDGDAQQEATPEGATGTGVASAGAFDTDQLLAAGEAVLKAGGPASHRAAARADMADSVLPEAFEGLRWFLLPHEG